MASSEDQSPEDRYGLSCPSGGSFYICATSQIRFLGCCGIDPYSKGGECPADALYPASYVNYSGLHQSCVTPYDESEWYTCDFTAPKFMGCCTRNPCNEGCPNANLIPAQLDDDDGIAAPFLSQPSSNTSTSTMLETPSQTETGVGEGVPSSDTAKEPSHTSTSRSTWLIVGLSMTGIVVFLVLVGIMIWWKKRENIWEFHNQKRRRPSSPRNENDN